MLSRASEFRLDGDLLTLSEHISQTTNGLHDLHNEVIQYASDVTDNFGLKMTVTCLHKAHIKMTERAIAAMEDATKHTKDVDEWSLFASGLALLDNIGPWFQELTILNNDLITKLAQLERYSSSSMMNKDDNSPAWEFNIFQFCAPTKFGDLQGLIDQALQGISEEKQPFLLEESRDSFARVAQYATDVAFSSFFGNVQSSLRTLCGQIDVWSKKDAPLPLCGYSPSELITRVGDNLLTLPQYLDPLSNEYTKIALRYTTLKYLDVTNTGRAYMFLIH